MISKKKELQLLGAILFSFNGVLSIVLIKTYNYYLEEVFLFIVGLVVFTCLSIIGLLIFSMPEKFKVFL